MQLYVSSDMFSWFETFSLISYQLNARIMLTRKENEVEELRRRVEEAKIKLGSEMKVRGVDSGAWGNLSQGTFHLGYDVGKTLSQPCISKTFSLTFCSYN